MAGPTHGERLTRLEAAADEIRREIARVERMTDRLAKELNGPGNGGRRSVRQRLHTIEGNDAAAKLARAALAAAEEEGAKRWTKRERAVALVVALWAVAIPTVNLIINLGR